MCLPARAKIAGILTSYERDVIQPHALGKFKDLLEGDGEKSGDALLSGQLS